MANQDKAFGFKLVGNLSGVNQNEVREYTNPIICVTTIVGLGPFREVSPLSVPVS